MSAYKNRVTATDTLTTSVDVAKANGASSQGERRWGASQDIHEIPSDQKLALFKKL
jgi:hypothetical protein